MTGLIFNIQRFSTKDGPGIRTTVFFKGCNVNCVWCHNPESIDTARVLRFDERRCISCGRCAGVCPSGATMMIDGRRCYNIEKCTLCGECESVCGADALELVGENISADELFSILLKDKDFYDESSGGVTFSGGEPLLQIDFLLEMLKKLKAQGIHTAIDTALNVAWERIDDVLPYTDLVLLDIKGMNPSKHLENTGVRTKRIHENALKLAEMDVDVIVRMPLVKGLNDSIEELTEAAEFVKTWPRLVGVELLAYHSLGVEKSAEYDALKQQAKFEPPELERLQKAAEIFRQAGVDNVT